MISGIFIFDIVRQKVKIYYSKFITEYFLAKHKRKHFFASSFQITNFTTLTIKSLNLAEAYSVIVGTFRRRAVSTIRRATSARRRAEPTMCRASLAIRRAESAIQRAMLAIRRANLTIDRAISAIWRADLTNKRGASTIHFIGVKTWFLTLSL
jgi:hypothetical protein